MIEMQNKFSNVYVAVILQAPLTPDLSLQRLALHLELRDVATDQEQCHSTISFSSCFLERWPLSGAHHFTPLLVLNEQHHNLGKQREHSKVDISIFFRIKLNHFRQEIAIPNSKI